MKNVILKVVSFFVGTNEECVQAEEKHAVSPPLGRIQMGLNLLQTLACWAPVPVLATPRT